MKDKLDAFMAKSWVAHIMRAVARFGNRLGSQFAAAITYFSVLALVPIAMLGFSAVGFALSTNPSLYDQVYSELTKQLGSSVMNGSFGALIRSWVKNWGGIAGVGGLSALYAGAGWISNLKNAIRAQWRPDFDLQGKKRNFFMELLVNLGLLLGMGVIGGASLIASGIGTVMNSFILHTLHFESLPGASLLTWLLGFLATLLAAFLLFLFVFAVMPRERAPKREYLLGSLYAALGLAILQSLTGVIISVLGSNKSAALFGPVIVLMLAFNWFAQLTLFIAAWIATTTQPAIAGKYSKADEPLKPPHEGTNARPGHWEEAEKDRIAQEEEKKQAEQTKIAKKERSAWRQ